MQAATTPSADVIVRPIRPDAFDAWVSLWAGYNAFYGR